jgi:glycosyltransferase involved in cell wall biosynthesis
MLRKTGQKDNGRPVTLRIAWIGPLPKRSGSVGSVSWLHLVGMARLGAEIDCYVSAERSDVPAGLLDEPGLSFICVAPSTSGQAWYGKNALSKFVAGQCARALAQGRLARAIVREHHSRPYDCLYQVSQIELFAVRFLRRELPPIILHPHTYARGELRWLWKERRLADRCTSWVKNRLVMLMQLVRVMVQAPDLRLATSVIVPSRVFASLLARDYRYDIDRINVVPNPICPEDMPFDPTYRGIGDTPIEGGDEDIVRLLVVSRMVARKGLDLVVDLSHELQDLRGRIMIEVVGGRSLWSDYIPLLADLHPGTAVYRGSVPYKQLGNVYQRADFFIAASRFEPFGLTVGEALGSGVPVIASDAVGAAEDVAESVCTRFADGDVKALAQAVRDAVEGLSESDRDRTRATARSEAARLFAPELSAATLLSALEAATSGTSP